MPTGPRLLVAKACYHIVARGNQKQNVFLDDKDLSVCLALLRKQKKKHDFRLYGFCFMPNHVHLVGEPKEQENLAKFMHGFLRSYTAYFNNRYKKVGHLWQGRFKSKVIVRDNYLLESIHYVEMNPVRANIVKAAGEYTWSSYKERVFSQVVSDKLLSEIAI